MGSQLSRWRQSRCDRIASQREARYLSVQVSQRERISFWIQEQCQDPVDWLHHLWPCNGDSDEAMIADMPPSQREDGPAERTRHAWFATDERRDAHS
jgi:hypothetical protein